VFGAEEEPWLRSYRRVQVLQRLVMMVGQHVGGAAPVASYADGKLLQNLGNFSSDSCAWISEQPSDGWRSLEHERPYVSTVHFNSKVKGLFAVPESQILDTHEVQRQYMQSV
jgi:hypothetical protein